MEFLKRSIPTAFKALSGVAPDLSAQAALKLFLRPQRPPMSPGEREFWERGEALSFASGTKGRAFGTGPRCVWIVHGWDSRASKYRPLIEALAVEGFKVIAWDGPAHGEHPDKETDLVNFARTLLADVRAHGSDVEVVIGHSFGGAASAYACHLGLPAQRLVMIASPSSILGVFTRFWDLIGLKAPARERFLGKVKTRTGVSPEQASAANILGVLGKPVLIVHDRNDKEIPFSDLDAYRGLENVSILPTNGLGHRRIVADRKVAESIAAFIRSAPGF